MASAGKPREARDWLIVGLGNPGTAFAGTRHNVGQMTADEIARRLGASWSTDGRRRASIAHGRSGGAGFNASGQGKIIVAKPLNAMNLSGEAVRNLASYYRILPESLLVLHDDIDIEFDTLKLKIGGGEGGHNGLRSISKTLGTKEYYRVRIGVGRPPARQDAADFVLKPFNAAERKVLPSLIGDSADAAEMLIGEGLTAAQNKYH